MTLLNLYKELSGNTFKVYHFLSFTAGERKVIHGITREKIQEECSLGQETVYKALKELKEIGLIDYKGQKQFCRIL